MRPWHGLSSTFGRATSVLACGLLTDNARVSVEGQTRKSNYAIVPTTAD